MCCVQGVTNTPSAQHQDGMEGRTDVHQLTAPSSKRLYNWNTTHFYPDVHKLDNDDLSVLRQRRHSEPRCVLRSSDGVSADRHSSGSNSSLSSSDEVTDKPDTIMPVSQLNVQLSAPSPIAKVDVDLDSGSESENDAQKTWYRSPLHVRRGRRSITSRYPEKKADLPTSAGVVGGHWKHAADRPSMRLKEQAEKRRRFLQQRCQMYGWDLTTDQAQQSAVDGPTDIPDATSECQDNIEYIDHSPENSSLNQDNSEHSPVSVAVKDHISQFNGTETPRELMVSNKSSDWSDTSARVIGADMSSPRSTSASVLVKESSSFENIYDTVSLEPDKPSDDVELVQLFEPGQARVEAVYCHTKPVTSSKPSHLQSSVIPGSYWPNGIYKNLPGLENVENTPVNVATNDINTTRPSSVPSKSTRKSSLDAKSLVEEEKLKFVEYRIEYRRQHSSGNESGSGKSDGEKDARRQRPEHVAVPPDDYEYILRKIHCNRPQNKIDDKLSGGQPYQGSELHIELKKPQVRTHHVTVDVRKPSVPHRVESLQHGGLICQLPAKPDVIPSPNYPFHPNVATAIGDGGDTTRKDLNTTPDRPLRTVLYSNPPSMLVQPAASPSVSKRHIRHLDSGIVRPDSERFTGHKPQYVGSAATVPQIIDLDRKQPEPPQEDPSQDRSPDLWQYNTTYEPSSLMQLQLPQLAFNKEPEHKDTAKLSDQDLVHDLVRRLDDNSELTPEATAVFREQYRLSIHEPCRSVKPDQLDRSQLTQLPCSEVFANSVCVPPKPVRLVHQTNQPSLKDCSGGSGRKETVFSVTGYHRPPEQKTSLDSNTSQNVCLKDERLYTSISDVCDSSSTYTAAGPEPLYWYSKADKRKPIVNSPEMETALNRDSQQRYFSCSGRQTNGQKKMWESRRTEKQSSELNTVVAAWNPDSCRTGKYADHDVDKDARLAGWKCQDMLVQQMSLGSQEVPGQLHSNPSLSATSSLLSSPQSIHVRAASHHIQTNKPVRQRPTHIGQHQVFQSVRTSEQKLSRASNDYEKHVLHGQESYRSRVIAQIEPSSGSAICTTDDNSLNAVIRPNVAGVFTDFMSHNISKSCSAGRMAPSKHDATRCDAGIPSDAVVHEAHYGKSGEQCVTDQEEPYPMSVAEIKAKLFGPNEDGARKLWQQHNSAVKESQTSRAEGRTVLHRRTHSQSDQKKRSFASDELTDFEKLVERLNKGDEPSDSYADWQNVVPPMTSVQCSSANDTSVRRLSFTNVKMLEDKSGKQFPNLEYAEEWLIGTSAPTNCSKESTHLPLSYATVQNASKSVVHSVTPAKNVGSIVPHKSLKSLPAAEAGDIEAHNAISNATTVVTKSHTSVPRSSTTEGCVIFRSHPAGQVSSIHGSSNSSFARRSLPALTEKDAERWRNMVLRIQENESRKEAKSCSVEQLSQLHCEPEMRSASAGSMQSPVRMPVAASTGVDRKLAVSAQSTRHSTPDTVSPTDPLSLKPKRQQTPRDVKGRNESRMKLIRANTDSGYLDGESDSRGSSVADISMQLPSQSNESDELELQRYTCDEVDDVKMTGESLSCVLADKNVAGEVSTSEKKVITLSPKSRSMQMQRPQEDLFGRNIQHTHSTSVSETADCWNTPEPDVFSKHGAVEYSDSSKFRKVLPPSLGLPKGKTVKPLYVSPLTPASGCGMYRTPLSSVSGLGDDQSSVSTVASEEFPGPSKISSFKMVFPSQRPRQNTDSVSKSTLMSQPSQVTHIPVRTVGLYSGQSLTGSSAFSPYVEHRDPQRYRQSRGNTSVAEITKEVPKHCDANKLLSRTVDQPPLMLESERLRHRQDINEPHVKITRQITDIRTQIPVRSGTYLQPKAAQLTVREEFDKCEMSDGEMTDATDVTLDVIVGANQSLTPTADAVDFSDVEFLSSANLPEKHDDRFMKSGGKPCVSDTFNNNLPDAHRLRPDGASGDAAVTTTKAEMQLYKKNNEDVKRNEPPVERRRSIKELVHSFEGLTSPFMRVRPRSMEITAISSSEEENQDNSVNERKCKKITLRASSSFKEASRLDRQYRHQATKNH